MKRLLTWLHSLFRRREKSTDEQMEALRRALEAELERHRHG